MLPLSLASNSPLLLYLIAVTRETSLLLIEVARPSHMFDDAIAGDMLYISQSDAASRLMLSTSKTYIACALARVVPGPWLQTHTAVRAQK